MDTEQEVIGLPNYTCATCQDTGTVLFTNPDGSQVQGPCPTHITADLPPVAEAIPEQPQEQVATPVVETQPQAIETTPEEKPLEGEVIEKHAGGRPTKYNEEILIKIQNYFEECFKGKRDQSGKLIKQPRTPFIEELELMLDINDDTIVEWSKQADKHEFSATYNKLKKLQKLRLKQLLVRGKTNPLGAKFLLEAEHGLMASEKKILAGESNAPLQIEIIEEAGKKQLMEEATT